MAFVINSYRTNNDRSSTGKEHHLLSVDMVADGAIISLSRHINLGNDERGIPQNETTGQVKHELFADELVELANHLLRVAEECEGRRITKNRDNALAAQYAREVKNGTIRTLTDPAA